MRDESGHSAPVTAEAVTVGEMIDLHSQVGATSVCARPEQVGTGDRPRFEVAPVSHFWLTRLVAIDSTWNPRHWSLRLFEQELSNQFAVVKGLFADTELVGYLIAHITFDEAHIVSFGLDPRWRRVGGGRYLLKEFIRSARLEGVSVFTLDVRISNEAAQRLYQSFGFAAAGVRKGYYSSNGEDAVSMRYEINDSGGPRIG